MTGTEGQGEEREGAIYIERDREREIEKDGGSGKERDRERDIDKGEEKYR